MSTHSWKLERLSRGYEPLCVLGAAAELDFLQKMIDESATAADIAMRCETDLRATTVLLDALAAMSFITKSADEEPLYRVADDYRDQLDESSSTSIMPMLRHRMTCLRQWSELSRVAKTGKSAPRQPSILGADEDFRSFILAMNSVALSLAPATAEALQTAGLTGFKRMLDIGGASGSYAKEFLECYTKAIATIFDRPAAIAEAKKRFEGTPLASRVTYAEGDFMQNALPSGFDFAWVSAIIHSFDREDARRLYRNVHGALDAKGVIAIRDFVMDSTRTAPLSGAMFAVNMLAVTPKGRCYSFDEIREDLEAEGFEDVKLAVPAQTMGAVVTAIRK